jgi:hypothetical protein
MTDNEFNHLLSHIDALSPDQIRQLRHELDNKFASSDADAQTILTAEEETEQDLQRRLFAAGLLSEIKPPRRVTTGNVPFAPVPIKGEPLSETVIRERR